MPSIIKRTSIRPTEPGPPTSPSGGPGRGPGARGARCRKDVQLLREGDVVRAIQLTCSCGESTVVELSYLEPPEGSA